MSIIAWVILGGLLAAGAVLVISVYYLTQQSLQSAIIENVPEADRAVITNVINNTDSVTSPYKVKVSVRNKYGEHIRDVEINAQKSDYFYRNQRIKLKN